VSRITGHNGIGRDIAYDDGASTDDRAISDRHPGEDDNMVSNVDIISDPHIPFGGWMAFDRICLPPENWKRIGADPIGPMLTSKKNEHLGRNRTILTDRERSSLPSRDHPRFSISMVANKISVTQEISRIEKVIGVGKQLLLDLLLNKSDSFNKLQTTRSEA
jgi:hypothetical protein